MVHTVNRVQVAAERIVAAPAAQVYEYIADYRNHHPQFLPQAFSDLVVERGGTGSGTIISFNLRVGGRSQRMRVAVEQPDPGRVLKEISLDSDNVTTFEVHPVEGGSRVSIHTEWTASRGVQGWIEQRLAPRLLARLFEQELVNLDRYARQHATSRPERVLTGVSD